MYGCKPGFTAVPWGRWSASRRYICAVALGPGDWATQPFVVQHIAVAMQCALHSAPGMDLTGGGVGVPPYPPPPSPPVVTRRHNMRHKKTRSQIEPSRVPGGRQHTPLLEAFNANHYIFQETVFCLFCWCTRVLIHCHCQYPVPTAAPTAPTARAIAAARRAAWLVFFSACRG